MSSFSKNESVVYLDSLKIKGARNDVTPKSWTV